MSTMKQELAFHGVEEIFNSMFVQLQRLLVVFIFIFFGGFGDQINSFLQLATENGPDIKSLLYIRLSLSALFGVND